MRSLPAAPLFDPGWLFLAAGVTLLGAAILIPAQAEKDDAQYLRDRALAMEAHRQARLDNYQKYLSALDRREPELVRSLAATQLAQMPSDRGLISAPLDGRVRQASVFPALEPPPLVLPTREAAPKSRLAEWSTGETSRLWMMAAGGVCALLGLIPGVRRR